MQAVCVDIPVRFAVRYSRGSRRTIATDLAPAVRSAIRYAYGDRAQSDDAAALAVYYTTDRAGFRLPASLPTDLPSERQSLAYVGALQNRTVDYRDLLPRLRHWQQDEQFDRCVRALNRAMEVFLEDFSDMRAEENPPRLTLAKGPHRVALDRLSDGERAVLAIVTDLVRRLTLANPDKNLNPLAGAGVVLIDEIELHLHPKWQREIVNRLRVTFPNIQFVATTHSPFVLQSLRPGELVNLDPEHFGEYADKSIEDIAQDVMGIQDPQQSVRREDMLVIAGEYFRTLESAQAAEGATLIALKNRLDDLAKVYDDDPAFVAFLEFQRVRALRAES